RHRRRSELGPIEAVPGRERLAQHLRRPHPVEPVRARLVALDVPRVDVPERNTPLDRVRLDCPGHDLLLLRLQVLDLDETMPLDRGRQLLDEPLLLTNVRRRSLRELEGTEGLLELRAHPVERRMCACRDHRTDELECQPDCPSLEWSEPRRPSERVTEQLLVDVHLIALELCVD